MNFPKWFWWTIAVLVVATAPIVGTLILGGSQIRCVGTDDAGELVKARGDECDRLSDVVIVGEDAVVEFGP